MVLQLLTRFACFHEAGQMQAALALVIVCVDIVFDVIHSVSESKEFQCLSS
jgi:hypothetical protein